jgi:hypothetical protein
VKKSRIHEIRGITGNIMNIKGEVEVNVNINGQGLNLRHLQVRSLYSRSGGRRPLHTIHPFTFCNLVYIPGVPFTNSCLEAFLSILSDILSILICSCHLPPWSFIPILHLQLYLNTLKTYFTVSVNSSPLR